VGVTPIDLYRAGNATGPKMDHVRPKDILIVQQNGADWVNPLTGGISTFENKIWNFGHWWLVPQGTQFDDRLTIRNDHDDHWVWEPRQGMELAEYVRLLTAVNGLFIPAP
jgi:hypothetical protein